MARYGKCTFKSDGLGFSFIITLLPTPPDSDLQQELHKEGIEAVYAEQEVEAYAYDLSDAFQSIGYQLSKGWEITGKQIIIKPEPMNKENVKVKINSQAEASALKTILDKLGEGTDKYFFGMYTDDMHLIVDSQTKDWILVNPNHSSLDSKTDISLKELLALLSSKPASILNGKCAIQVNNEREFKLLMENYESKGWKWEGGEIPTEWMHVDRFPVNVDYADGFTRTSNIAYHSTTGYIIIPFADFADFANEVGITVPVFVMKSEDGVDLYDGDDFYYAYRDEAEQWRYQQPSRKILPQEASAKHLKMFSTKEAAEMWIAEQNKPKEILVDGYGSYGTTVTAKEIRVNCGDSVLHDANLTFSPAEFEAIYTAFKSLQP
jgi:hypothetical protein